LDIAIASLFNILLIGDIVGSPGRDVVSRYVPLTREQHDIHLCIANGENAAAGFGLTESTAQELFKSGIDIITSGNHIYDKREFRPYLDASKTVIRPANYPESAPGHGSTTITVDGTTVGVVNLMGRVFMPPVDDPFAVGRRVVDKLREETQIIVVDMHAEATSEKLALARYLDGDISALVGTHTHVQTSDEQILPKGTAFLTDLGMTGPTDGVIGMEAGAVIERFTNAISERYSVVKSGPCQFGALVVGVDRATGKAISTKRIYIRNIGGRT
jgi:metallophosphoesterase (TIGR00282 family)